MSVTALLRNSAIATLAAGAMMVLAPSLASAKPGLLNPAPDTTLTDVQKVQGHHHHARRHHYHRHHHHRRHR